MKNNQLNFQAYGVKISLNSTDTEDIKEVESRLNFILPNGFELIEEKETDHKFIISRKENGDWQLYKNEENVANSNQLTEFYGFVESEIRRTVAEYAVSKVFLHAGVVGWKGRAIVIPGNSFSGKTSLVAALIKKGALYYSDEYAVLDEEGNVYPFPKMLSLRGIIDDFQQLDHPVEALGGKAGIEPIPVGMFLITHFDSEIKSNENDVEKYNPEILSEGQGVLEILKQSISIRYNPKFVLHVLNQAVSRAIIAKSKRGEAEEFAGILLDFFDKKSVN